MKKLVKEKKSAAKNVWNSKTKTYAERSIVGPDILPEFSDLVRTLLVSRGIETSSEAEKFLNPDYDLHTHDPFLMKDMKKAVDRILRAIENNERIAFFTDYDCDGLPAGVLFHDLMKKIGYQNFENYIPHRHEEGFGLNMEAIDKLFSRDVKLMITADCGITDVVEVEYAKEKGIDVIITDHHLPPAGGAPRAYAVINIKQEDCEYPDKNLCGAGTAWKLATAVLKEGNERKKFITNPGAEKWLLDMAGLATLSDMVPLSGENRVIAFYGMKVLRRSPRVGLSKLFRNAGIDQTQLTEEDIAFTLTPRINAASRMGVPRDAFDLLATADHFEADRLARYLNQMNDERKVVVATIAREARKHLHERDPEFTKPLIVMGNPDWKPSLLGLVANSLAEEFKRPVFLWGRSASSHEDAESSKHQALLKGSCRSGNGVNIVKIMERAKHIFADFGGHTMAGGFSVPHESIHLLEEALLQGYEEFQTTASGEAEVISIDKRLLLSDVNGDTYRDIEKLAPFGVGNPKPLFLFPHVKVQSVRMFGKGNLHLEVMFESDSNSVKGISFFTKPDAYGIDLNEGEKVNLIAQFDKSIYRGRTELRLRIIDLVS